MITKKHGDILLNYLQTASLKEKASASLLADFQITRQDDRVEYEIYFTSSNDHALDFIYDFKDSYMAL